MVIWSEPAQYDLKNIHEYISLDSPFYAQQVTLAIVEKTETLLQFPTIGRVVPEINDNNIREIFIHSYRVMYEIEKDNIVIHAVMHGKRDFDKAFEYNEEVPPKQQ